MPGTMRRDLVIGVDAETGKAEQGFERTKRGASSYERELRKLERQQAKVDAAMDKVGKGMLVAGAAIAAGLGLAIKAAIDWESSWAGVLKTVDGTDEQMAALEEEIRGLTAVLPASHAEIAAVAEAAGQLGVQRENVAAFTKTMIDMGEATNLTSDAAATALARLMNIMQTAPGDVDRLSSAIVDLGNKGATTEAEITEMALRIAGAGRTIGLSEQQVLAFAAALSNVGIRAEAGGTAISKVFLEIDTAVTAGGASLDTFAITAGMSADQFRRAYERDAGAAIASFVQGLARVQESGGDVNAILADLGLTEIRVSDALRRLAGSGDNLTTALALSNKAWEENSALTDEANRRYETAAARLAIARNQLNDFAIDMGAVFLPAVAETADALGGFVDFLGGMPDPLRSGVAILAVATAGLLLLGGAALVTIPKIHATRKALVEMGLAARLANSRLGAVAAGAGKAAGALGVLAGISLGLEATVKRLDPDLEALAVGLERWATTGEAGGEAAKLLGENFDKLDRALISAADEGVTRVTATIAEGLIPTTKNMDDSLARAVERVDSIDAALAALVRAGSAQQAADVFDALAQRAEENGISQEKLVEILPQYGAALEAAGAAAEGSAAAAGKLDSTTQGLADTFGLGAEQAQELAGGIEGLDDALDQLFTTMFSVEEAQDAATQTMRRMTEEAKENQGGLEGNSEAALSNRDNVREVIRAHLELIATMAEGGASADQLTGKTEKLRQQLVDQMRQAGFSEEAIEEYAEAYDLIPSEVQTRISTPGMTAAERNARNLRHAIDRIPRNVGVHFAMSTSGTAPVGSGRIAFQHGGEVEGPPGIDRVPVAATAGEIIIQQPVAQMHREQLLALNRTGRLPVNPPGHETRPQPTEIVIRGDGTARADFIIQEIQRALRTDSSFRSSVRAHVAR